MWNALRRLKKGQSTHAGCDFVQGLNSWNGSTSFNFPDTWKSPKEKGYVLGSEALTFFRKTDTFMSMFGKGPLFIRIELTVRKLHGAWLPKGPWPGGFV